MDDETISCTYACCNQRLFSGSVLCMIVLMTALCVVSGDADEQAEAAYRHFLESRGRKA